jgi:delta24(24(1))-sterol reductase
VLVVAICSFKMQQQGVYKPRKSFPQLPGAIVENPTYIETKHGNKLLTSGWWAYARKPVSTPIDPGLDDG